jgi:hypothetical protein
MARLLLAAFLVLAARPAEALDLNALPAPVKAEMELAHTGCIDGRTLKIGPNGLRRLDLSGEGRADYVIDDGDITCSGAHDFCGSGGCTLAIFMQGPKGYAKVWDDVAISAAFARRAKGYGLTLRVKVPGGYPLTTTRLVFAHGCAVDLTHGRKRLCGAG